MISCPSSRRQYLKSKKPQKPRLSLCLCLLQRRGTVTSLLPYLPRERSERCRHQRLPTDCSPSKSFSTRPQVRNICGGLNNQFCLTTSLPLVCELRRNTLLPVSEYIWPRIKPTGTFIVCMHLLKREHWLTSST